MDMESSRDDSSSGTDEDRKRKKNKDKKSKKEKKDKAHKVKKAKHGKSEKRRKSHEKDKERGPVQLSKVRESRQPVIRHLSCGYSPSGDIKSVHATHCTPVSSAPRETELRIRVLSVPAAPSRRWGAVQRHLGKEGK